MRGGRCSVVKNFYVEHDNRAGLVCISDLHQYDVATMSCVYVIPQLSGESFAISPCSRVVVAMQRGGVIVTRHLYPHNSE